MLRYNEFDHAIRNAVSVSLTSPFEFKGVQYETTSYNLRKKIADEILNTLSQANLSPTQLAILNHATTDITLLAKTIIGSLNTETNHNIVTGYGYHPTGLSKVYFSALKTKKLSFIDDLTLGLKHIGQSDNYDFIVNNISPTYCATSDNLNGDFHAWREKPIILAFCNALLDIASPEQLQKLLEEANNPHESPLLMILAKKQGLGAFSEGQARSFTTYKTALTSKMAESQANLKEEIALALDM